jgi:signal transduction histidine kinase
MAARAPGYVVALAVPLALTYIVAFASAPAFVFEHLVVLVVVGVAIPWGLGPAILAAVVSVMADNILLQEPVGRPAITGLRDVLDLTLFAAVAVIVSGLVRRAHDARRAAEEAAERERRARADRGRLIEAISHDLATPLSVLRTSVQFAKRAGTTSGEDWTRLLQRLDTATERAISLVRLLSDVEAAESADIAIEVADHDLRDVIAPIVIMMDRCSERHPVVLALPGEPVAIRGDAGRLQRVIENLIGNAIKYSPNGGAVEVSLGVSGNQAVVQVRDYGIGISPAEASRVFDRSYRAPQAAARVGGSGLGLSIAAQVVSRHGGTITASPANGPGTVMEVRLPLGQRPRPADSSQVAATKKQPAASVH